MALVGPLHSLRSFRRRLPLALGVTSAMLEPARLLDTWPTLIGKFLLAFGDLELGSFFLWERYFQQAPAPTNFKERTAKLLYHTARDEGISPIVTDVLRESLQLADKRNAVAHNPLSVQIYRHSETGELTHKLGIRPKFGGDYITDEHLVDLANRAQLLAEQLHNGIWRWDM